MFSLHPVRALALSPKARVLRGESCAVTDAICWSRKHALLLAPERISCAVHMLTLCPVLSHLSLIKVFALLLMN